MTRPVTPTVNSTVRELKEHSSGVKIVSVPGCFHPELFWSCAVLVRISLVLGRVFVIFSNSISLFLLQLVQLVNGELTVT